VTGLEHMQFSRNCPVDPAPAITGSLKFDNIHKPANDWFFMPA
jgi:hypothetical protein